MSLNEQYLLYTFANDLVKNHQFNLLYLNEKTNEVWLEKYENHSSIVVRLIHKGFDWKNHLKQDISFLFQRVRNVKQVLKKNIEVYNLYFTMHQPVDTWDILKQPLTAEGKPKVSMRVYYLDQEEYEHEAERFEKDLLPSPISYDLELPDETKENNIEKIKYHFVSLLSNKRKEVENIFSFGKPLFSYAFIIINLLYFFYMEWQGDTTSIEMLIQFGAKYNPSMMIDGEWWRLFSSMFIHIGFIHLALNMLAVFYLGTAVEKIFGSSRFIFIYLLAGLGGSIASFAYTTSVSAGASGAIFGLFGAFLYFGIVHKRLFFQTIGSSILLVLAINLVIGLSIEGIDMAAHVGGLIAGFLAAAIVGMPKNKRPVFQFAAAISTAIFFFAVTYYGVHANESSETFRLMQIQEHLNQHEYDEVVTVATEALALEGDMESSLLFQRSYANIELGNYEEALRDLEKSVTLQEPLPEAYYNLAILYDMDGEVEKSIQAIEQAYQMDPTNEDFINLYELITGDSPREADN
ncbi:rhomboid family intramembrane serine protease [Oceanobacillus alkalisoli]|uniref:rhomboid family intramembrane serine protease n=1 Tax=Oceanobacillus alkalisoli TaxID=2925113 RepID=UPI001EEFE13D|nr:rhomboid family intramembrane serine protease [Oceanobacillus alkalisoli]MCF3941773.1 rhomboid family intramembrane serine protease [Oceanobacillus alkalisoli]MCG5103053.1 rhomboid family intramembrane serine protease [Oceanobacillus alkalisoli]